jgi:hypothetical protein
MPARLDLSDTNPTGNDLWPSGVLSASNFWLRGNSAPGPFPFFKDGPRPCDPSILVV